MIINNSSFSDLSLSNLSLSNLSLSKGFYSRITSELWLWIIFCEWIYNSRHIFFTLYINDN